MADSETDTREAAAELRITRVKALDDQNLVAVVTYLLAKYPDTFPPMLEGYLHMVAWRGPNIVPNHLRLSLRGKGSGM